MDKLKILIVLFVSINSFSQSSSVQKIFKNICRENLRIYEDLKDKKNEKKSFKIRKEIAKNGKFSFILNDSNLFIVEGDDFETGETYVTIWNKLGALTYKRDDDYKYEILNEDFISGKLKEMLMNWKLDEIKKISKGDRAVISGLHMGICRYQLDVNGNVTNVVRDSFDGFDDTDW